MPCSFAKRVQMFIFLGIFFSCRSSRVSGEQDAVRPSSRGIYFSIEESSALKGHIIATSTVSSFLECGLKCASSQPGCKSFNYVEKSNNELPVCELNSNTKHCASRQDLVRQSDSKYAESITAATDKTCSICENGGIYQVTSEPAGFKCTCKKWFDGELCQNAGYTSCRNMTEQQSSTIVTSLNGFPLQVFCDATRVDGGWTLVARFSNKDTKHWMENQGTWWYDRVAPYGETLDPGHNGDMISEAFWLQKGSEFRITRSNDPTHTALLTTTGNCQGGQTFRSKMVSYGIFRGSSSWGADGCLGSCSVVYGGDYTVVSGFSQSQCDGDIQTRNKIGFWCDYNAGDGSVIMIGGGGSGCSRANHGIGVTDDNSGRFETLEQEIDFGDETSSVQNTYALNLWVR